MGGYAIGEVPFHGVRPQNNKIGGVGSVDKTMWRVGKAAEYAGMAVGTYQAVQAARQTLQPVLMGLRAAIL